MENKTMEIEPDKEPERNGRKYQIDAKGQQRLVKG